MSKRVPLLFLAVALFVACEPADIVAPRDPKVPASPSPVAGGHLVIGVYGEPATLDPYSPDASDLTWALARPLYRSLYVFDEQGEPVPDLAARLRTSGDVATVTLGSAMWSDGTPITSHKVASSLTRAAQSGFIDLDSIRRAGPRRVVLSGDVEDWEEALAAASVVLPDDFPNRPSETSGPFRLRSRVPGLQMVLTPNPGSENPPLLDKLTIRFTEGVDMLLALLEAGDLDAAWLPSTVNLSQRLEELDLEHDQRLGWELVTLDLSGSALDRSQRRDVARSLDRSEIEEGFVRDDGRITDTLIPSPEPGGASGPFEAMFRGSSDVDDVPLRMAAPGGDELLELVQRLGQVQLSSAGFDVELINVDARRFYGEWGRQPPLDVAVRRRVALPGSDAPPVRTLTELPLFQVDSFVAWNEGAGGLEAGGPAGPLAHAHQWHVLP